MPIPSIPSPLVSILATSTYDSNWFAGDTLEAQIQNAINSAAADGAARVLVHGPYNASQVTFNNSVKMVIEGQDWGDYNVLAYGASGNGVTDDTTAIQAAINAAPPGGVVYIPTTTLDYIISNLTITKPLSLIGDGWGMTGQTRAFGQASELIAATTPLFNGARLRAKAGATGYMLTIGPPGNGNQWMSYQGELEAVTVRGIFFDGNVRGPDMGAIALSKVEQSQFLGLKIEHFKREALYFDTAVRECVFDRIWIRYCADIDNGYPVINLKDHAAGVESHNFLFFSHITVAYGFGDTILLDTTAGAATLTRDIYFHNSVFHGLVPGIDGFPYTITAGQKVLTHVQQRSSSNIRFNHCYMVSPGLAPANAVHSKNGSHATGPSTLVLTDCYLAGRYDTTGTPRYGVWIENGDVRLAGGTTIDCGDTSNVRMEAGTNLSVDPTVSAVQGYSLANTPSLVLIPMQVTFGAQLGVEAAVDDLTFLIKSLNTGGHQWNFVSAANASGNVPGGAGGHYLYDLTAGARRYYIRNDNGYFQHDKGMGSGLVTPSEAVLVSGVDASAGNAVVVTLTAARLVGAPLSPTTGQRLLFTFIQDGTGGRVVTWNAVFKVSWSDTGNTLNRRSSIAFSYDGTNWNQDGAQTPYIT